MDNKDWIILALVLVVVLFAFGGFGMMNGFGFGGYGCLGGIR